MIPPAATRRLESIRWGRPAYVLQLVNAYSGFRNRFPGPTIATELDVNTKSVIEWDIRSSD